MTKTAFGEVAANVAQDVVEKIVLPEWKIVRTRSVCVHSIEEEAVYNLEVFGMALLRPEDN